MQLEPSNSEFCGICKNEYTDPRVLPCSHIFCCACLREHIMRTVAKHSTESFPCPSCKVFARSCVRGSHPKSWAFKFPKEVMKSCCSEAISKQDDIEQILKQPSDCGFHPGIMTSRYCKTCNLLICDECLDPTHLPPACHTVTADKISDKVNKEYEMMGRSFDEQQQFVAEKCRQMNAGSQNRSLLAAKIETIRRLDDIQKTINEIRMKALKSVNVLRQQCEEAYDFADNQTYLHEHVEMLNSSVAYAQTTLEKVQESDNSNVRLKAIPLMMGLSGKHDEIIEQMKEERPSPVMEFVVNPDFQRFIDTFTNVGRLEYLTQEQDNLTHIKPDTTRQVKEDKHQLIFSTVLDGEISCDISGLAATAERIIVADSSNKILKLFTFAGTLVSTLSMHAAPNRVAAFQNSSEAVVSSRSDKTLTFITTRPRLRQLRTAKARRLYTDISTMGENHILASCCEGNFVDILDTRITIVKRITLNFEMNGQRVFTWPWSVAGITDNKILISDREKGLFCLSISGEITFVYRPSGIQPRDVYADGKGSVFLARGDNDTVEKLTQDGKLHSVAVERSDGIGSPSLLCTSNRRLVVAGSENNGLVHVFSA